MKNSLQGFNSRYKLAEKRMSKLEDRSVEIIQSRKKSKKE